MEVFPVVVESKITENIKPINVLSFYNIFRVFEKNPGYQN